MMIRDNFVSHRHTTTGRDTSTTFRTLSCLALWFKPHIPDKKFWTIHLQLYLKMT
jgi:hypothetical protein